MKEQEKLDLNPQSTVYPVAPPLLLMSPFTRVVGVDTHRHTHAVTHFYISALNIEKATPFETGQASLFFFFFLPLTSSCSKKKKTYNII